MTTNWWLRWRQALQGEERRIVNEDATREALLLEAEHDAAEVAARIRALMAHRVLAHLRRLEDR